MHEVMQACTCYCPGHFSTQIHTQVTLQIKKRKHCWIISQHDPFSISQGIGLKAEQGTASEENWPSEAVSQCRCGWCNLKLGLRSKRPTAFATTADGMFHCQHYCIRIQLHSQSTVMN